jgi:aspartyl-tRNA(Asn)/glutamyl-tRNA(Gln) amidotransferase subunit A
VPITIKDLILTKGWATLRGSLTTSPGKPEDWDEEAPPVQRLRESGAVFLGKTTTPEYGWKGVTDSPRTGITRNPWNPNLTSGGSSGGASVAAALGMGTLHLSSDGGGSARLPGCFTGVVGFKPTFGRVPNYPSAHTGTLAHPSITTRTVEDAALMLNVISRPDSHARDWYALPEDKTDYLAQLDHEGEGGQPLAGLRIVYSSTFTHNVYDEHGLFVREEDYKVDSEIQSKVDAAVKVLEELGATVKRVNASDINPALKKALEIYDTFWRVGAAKLVRSFTGDQAFKVETG